MRDLRIAKSFGEKSERIHKQNYESFDQENSTEIRGKMRTKLKNLVCKERKNIIYYITKNQITYLNEMFYYLPNNYLK